jgi:hypothetical protein
MDQHHDLQSDGHWRTAVWALRVGYGCLAVALVGLIVLVSGPTPWLLAVGVVGWLGAAVVMVIGFLWARRGLAAPRPGFWAIRSMLLYDTVHTRTSGPPS